MRILKALCLSLSIAALAACAAMAGAPTQLSDGVLTNTAGMTLYTYDNDPAGSGKSTCNGPCATNWPPLFADAGASARGDYTIISRDDGRKQWAYKGKPLYLWVQDKKPGDRTGDGFRNVWRLAKP